MTQQGPRPLGLPPVDKIGVLGPGGPQDQFISPNRRKIGPNVPGGFFLGHDMGFQLQQKFCKNSTPRSSKLWPFYLLGRGGGSMKT